MSRGTYERTPEIRERNRRSAVTPAPCPDGCTCARHTNRGGGRPCAPDCTCGRHQRSKQHNAKIAIGVKTTRGKR